jgi:RNA ligase
MRLSDIVDPALIETMLTEGFLKRCEGPDGLVMYGYTDRAQYARQWNPATLTCRGLVVRDDWTIQSRPFGKFFNLAEHATDWLPDLPVEPFDVFEKLDGSLIVVSALDDDVLITSRGSVHARRLWKERYDGLRPAPGVTWCFELIAPWNRIVVDYGDRDELVFLAAIDNHTGTDLPIPCDWPGPVVGRLDGLADFEEVVARMATLGPNEEGYVLRFASGMRAKAKGAEYVRLHRLVTGVSAKTIWECLAAGQPLDEMLNRVPDEFYRWVEVTADSLGHAYADIETECRVRLAEVSELPTRKDQALAIADFAHKAVVFKMLDGKPHAEAIWRMLRPAAERPFKVEA